MHFNLDHHLKLLHLVMNKELSEIYLSFSIRSLAVSMISIFVPLFLIKELQYSLPEVIKFFMVFAFAMGIATPIVAPLCTRIGFKHSILLSTPLFIAFYAFLYNLESNSVFFYYIPILLGVGNSLFWLPYHTDFALSTKKNTSGKAVGSLYTLMVLIAMVAPFIGGFILTFFGFHALLIITGSLLLISAIPLLRSEDIHPKANFSLRYIFDKSHFHDFLNFVVLGIRIIAEGLYWPIILFTILNTYLSIGFLATASSLFAALTAYIVGIYSDYLDKRTLIRLGTLVMAISWVIRYFTRTQFTASFITLAISFFSPLLDVPFDAYTYDQARRKKNLVEYLVFREIAICIGRIIILSLGLLFATLTPIYFFTAIVTLINFFF